MLVSRWRGEGWCLIRALGRERGDISDVLTGHQSEGEGGLQAWGGSGFPADVPNQPQKPW